MDLADVVVTGVGMVTPLGATAGETLAAWRAGACATRRTLPELAETPLAAAEVAALPGLQAATSRVPRRMLKYLSEGSAIGSAAAADAAAEADVALRFQPERIGLYAGAGLPATNAKEAHRAILMSVDDEGETGVRLFGSRGMACLNPLLPFKSLANMPACCLSILQSIRGPSFIFSPWESQSAAALIEAWQAVATGDVDCALAGATEYPIHPITVLYLHQEGLLAEGEVPGAAAAYLILERAESAARDGRPAHARIAGMSVAAVDPEAIRQPTHGPGAVSGVARRRAVEGCHHPLAPRMGRTFAAAPAVALALACLEGGGSVSLRGVDGWEFRAEVEAPR